MVRMINPGSRQYVGRIAEIVHSVLGSDALGVYLVGSMAFDDFAPVQSDIDVLAISSRSVSKDGKRSLARRLDHEQLPCPAVGLDLAIFRSEVVSKPPRVPSYELAISTGPTWDLEVSVGGAEPELLIDFAVCRHRGLTITGPPPKELFGDVPRPALIDAMKVAIRWSRDHVHHAFHDPLGHFAVLNTSRAWRYLEEDVLCSKSEGGEWALERLPSLTIVGEALAIRRGERRDKLDRERVIALIDKVANL